MSAQETVMDVEEMGKRVHEVDKRQSTHEVECEARYKAIGVRIDGLVERMKRGEILLWVLMVVTLLGIGNHPNGAIGFFRELLVKGAG